MKTIKILIVIFLNLSFVICHLPVASLVEPSFAASPAVRVKDIAHVLEARENQLMGFGLVVGLRNTGDKGQTGFTQQALTNLLSRMGMVPQSVDFKSKNVAAVMVTATLPPFIKTGQKMDVTVSSVGDATSLQGGTLLITPLSGVDDQVYAVAQGNLSVAADVSTPQIPYVRLRQTTVGRIPGGALVEREVPVTIGSNNVLTIVLNDSDFTTAKRVADSMRRAGLDASAKDAGTITLPFAAGEDAVELVSRIENLSVVPDVVAKVVINERTGTIVIGENVRIAPVAVSYANIDVTIGDITMFTEGSDVGTEVGLSDTRFRVNTRAKMNKKEGELTLVSGGTTLSNLVRALNAIGASPKDMISILQAMKKAGALKAELEVI